MTAKVHELKTRPATLNEQTIELLRDYLARAESGELIAVAIAGICRDGTSLTAGSESDSIHQLLGAMRFLEHRMIAGHG